MAKVAVLLICFFMCFCSLVSADQSDLCFGEVKLNTDCKVEVEISNRGPGNIPVGFAGISLSVQAVKNNKGAGGWSYNNIGYSQGIPAGGSVRMIIWPLAITDLTEVRLDIDSNNKVVEVNESNNRVIRDFVCPGYEQTQQPSDNTNTTSSGTANLKTGILKAPPKVNFKAIQR